MSTKQIMNENAEAKTQTAVPNAPFNAVTGKTYFGAKAQRLSSEAAYRGYPSDDWATLRQWNSVKETVAKGQKGTLMIHTEKLPDGTEREKRSFLYNSCQLESMKDGSKR